MVDHANESTSPVSAWGTFLTPDPALTDVENLHDKLGITILSGHRADLQSFAGTNLIFDQIAATISGVKIACEDQCSTLHYFDIFGCIERFRGSTAEQPGPAKQPKLARRGLFRDRKIGPQAGLVDPRVLRVVDVGVFMGGSSVVFAGCVEPLGVELDLVDINETYLQFTYERLRRTFPNAMPKVRMFYGDLPTYVQNVLLTEDGTESFVHHDGAHDFGQVVKDLSSLYFARDRVRGVALQDTHLRCSNVTFLNFVDAAVYAVFGADVQYDPLGARYGSDSPLMNPDQYFGNYFLANQPEGMYIDFGKNEFRYPHSQMALELFLPGQANVRS